MRHVFNIEMSKCVFSDYMKSEFQVKHGQFASKMNLKIFS